MNLPHPPPLLDGPVLDPRENVERQWLLTARTRVGWLDIYRDSAFADWRAPFRDALQTVLPFDTVIDLGCNCGALMPLLLSVAPQVSVLGIDLAPVAIAAAKQAWPYHMWMCGSLVDWVPLLRTRRFDVVTSASTLCCIPPTCIGEILDALAVMATRAIVLQEPAPTPRYPEGRSSSGMPEWRHDYILRLGALGWTCVRTVWQDVTTHRPGAVMTFRRDGELT